MHIQHATFCSFKIVYMQPGVGRFIYESRC